MDVIAGILIAALAGMGIGGGGLLVLYLVFIKGMGQLEAQGLNLIFFIFASGASLIYHGRKRKIKWKVAAMLMLFGSFGAWLGAVTASKLDESVVRTIFGWLLIISGL